MAVLGLLSIAQFLFLPGFLALQLKNHCLQKVDQLILSVPLSGVINFFLVYFLVLTKLYTQGVLLSIVVSEIICLVVLTRLRNLGLNQLVEKNTFIEFRIDALNIFIAIFFLFYVCQFINQIGTVFTHGDAVMSWNAWGISWSESIIPTDISWYPQLLPANYSLSYVLMGNKEVELAAKIGISFYPLMAFAIVFRLAQLFPDERKKILWTGIIFFLLVRTLWGVENTVNGYADFPLAFFSLAIIYVFLLKISFNTKKLNSDCYLIPVLIISLAIGAGMVKQSGVYLAAITPFAWLLLFYPKINFKYHIKQSFFIGFITLIGLASWYLYQYLRIEAGISSSNHNYLAQIVRLPWHESIVYGIRGLNQKLSILWIPLLFLSLFKYKIKYITIIVVVPYILIWAALVPYDYRNLAPIFPFMSLSIVSGFVIFLSIMNRLFDGKLFLSWCKKATLALIFIVLCFFISTPKNDVELIKLSNNAKEAMGGQLTARLIHYFEVNSDNALVATPFSEMGKVPILKNRFKQIGCGSINDELPIRDTLSEFQSDANIKYVLLFEWCNQKLLNYFAEHPLEFNKIFKYKNATFYKIVER